jgi:hypothetical protein
MPQVTMDAKDEAIIMQQFNRGLIENCISDGAIMITSKFHDKEKNIARILQVADFCKDDFTQYYTANKAKYSARQIATAGIQLLAEIKPDDYAFLDVTKSLGARLDALLNPKPRPRL